jgi:hypothetical protein
MLLICTYIISVMLHKNNDEKNRGDRLLVQRIICVSVNSHITLINLFNSQIKWILEIGAFLHLAEQLYAVNVCKTRQTCTCKYLLFLPHSRSITEYIY